jgi:hypothetical protein
MDLKTPMNAMDAEEGKTLVERLTNVSVVSNALLMKNYRPQI